MMEILNSFVAQADESFLKCTLNLAEIPVTYYLL